MMDFSSMLYNAKTNHTLFLKTELLRWSSVRVWQLHPDCIRSHTITVPNVKPWPANVAVSAGQIYPAWYMKLRCNPVDQNGVLHSSVVKRGQGTRRRHVLRMHLKHIGFYSHLNSRQRRWHKLMPYMNPTRHSKANTYNTYYRVRLALHVQIQ